MVKTETAYDDMLRVRNIIRVIDQSTIEEAEKLIEILKKHIDECLIKYKDTDSIYTSVGLDTESSYPLKEGEDECDR